jgi:transcriptional antiterminator NusG
MAFKWYVVHTYSGYENKVKMSLQERVELASAQASFSDILIPEEDVVELISGEKKTSKVTGFIGSKDKPSPISDKDVENLKVRIDEGTLKPKPKFKFDVGDHVKIIDGPFTNFDGVIDEVKPEKGKLRVIVSIFGRPTPVELDFIQVMQG